MIQERNFGGLIFDPRRNIHQQIDKAVRLHKPRVVYPGDYDISPDDTRFREYEYQKIHVFQDGHGEIRGRRNRAAATEEYIPRNIQSEEGTLQQISTKVAVAPAITDELLADLNEQKDKVFFLFTMDVDHFLRTKEFRRRLWRVFSYHPGAYPQVH